jgi:hypothetical protein
MCENSYGEKENKHDGNSYFNIRLDEMGSQMLWFHISGSLVLEDGGMLRYLTHRYPQTFSSGMQKDSICVELTANS